MYIVYIDECSRKFSFKEMIVYQTINVLKQLHKIIFIITKKEKRKKKKEKRKKKKNVPFVSMENLVLSDFLWSTKKILLIFQECFLGFLLSIFLKTTLFYSKLNKGN